MLFATSRKNWLQTTIFLLVFVSFHVFKCLEYDHMPNEKKIDSKSHFFLFLLAMGRNMVSKVIVCMITSHNDSLWSWMCYLWWKCFVPSQIYRNLETPTTISRACTIIDVPWEWPLNLFQSNSFLLLYLKTQML